MAKVTPEHAKMIKEGKATIVDIAKMAGVSKQAVVQMIKKYIANESLKKEAAE